LIWQQVTKHDLSTLHVRNELNWITGTVLLFGVTLDDYLLERNAKIRRKCWSRTMSIMNHGNWTKLRSCHVCASYRFRT
jgi:hypothetical protein